MSKESGKDWKTFKETNAPEDNAIESELDETLEEVSQPVNSEEQSALDHPSYQNLEEKLTLAEQKAHENWEKAVRAVAELENVRRRAERDVAHAHRYSLEKIIASLIPVVDSLEQALQLADKEAHASMAEGLQLTLKLFLDVLAKHNVQPINPEGGQFDPQEHEAMSIQETSDAAPNSVLVVFQKGYKLNDRIIRPARVIVAKAKSNE